MSKTTIFYLHAFDNYKDDSFTTRYFIDTKEDGGGLIDIIEGVENTVNKILETIKNNDLAVQRIVFRDPCPYNDHIKVNLLNAGDSDLLRIRTLSEKERQEFCFAFTRLKNK